MFLPILGQAKRLDNIHKKSKANEHLIERKVKDSNDTMTDEQIKQTGNKIRAYVTTMAVGVSKLLFRNQMQPDYFSYLS